MPKLKTKSSAKKRFKISCKRLSNSRRIERTSCKTIEKSWIL